VGYTDDVANLIVELEVLKVSTRKEAIKTASANRELAAVKRDTQAALVDQYRKGLIDENALSAGLSSLGLSADVVSSLTQKEIALKAPTPRLYRPPPPEALLQTIAQRTRQVILTSYKKGVIDRPTAEAELLATNESPALITQDLDLAEVQSAKTPKKAAPDPAALKTQTALKDAALKLYEAGQLDDAGLVSRLLQIGLPQELASADLQLEQAKAAAKAAAKQATKAKTPATPAAPIGG
jgi:hypothetical protein